MSRDDANLELIDTLDDFDGRVRLFPLPQTVLFPGVLMPLHIFEPRYREMLADALQGDGRITMVLLTPGWEAHYERRPEIHSVGCLGRVVRYEPLPDGRSNLVLRGTARVHILSEEPPLRPFRTAHVRILYDNESPLSELPPGSDPAHLWRKLQSASSVVTEAIQSVARVGSLTPGRFCDLAAHALGMPAPLQQQLLEELDVARRLEHFAAWLKTLIAEEKQRRPPSGASPDFTPN
jgi:Lon protease-like protein